MAHRDPLVAAQARIEALERALELARDERADLAKYAAFDAELDRLRRENDALHAEVAELRSTLTAEREARRDGLGWERASLEAEIARLRTEVADLRAVLEASRARAVRVDERAEPEPDPNVLRVDPDRVAEGGACPACHASALTTYPASGGLVSVVCGRCGHVELRALG
jgi:septal ring factor EnvC (AmiA/AmiB activator)